MTQGSTLKWQCPCRASLGLVVSKVKGHVIQATSTTHVRLLRRTWAGESQRLATPGPEVAPRDLRRPAHAAVSIMLSQAGLIRPVGWCIRVNKTTVRVSGAGRAPAPRVRLTFSQSRETRHHRMEPGNFVPCHVRSTDLGAVHLDETCWRRAAEAESWGYCGLQRRGK
jgi:hypothetical protein